MCCSECSFPRFSILWMGVEFSVGLGNRAIVFCEELSLPDPPLGMSAPSLTPNFGPQITFKIRTVLRFSSKVIKFSTYS